MLAAVLISVCAIFAVGYVLNMTMRFIERHTDRKGRKRQ